MLFRFNTPTLNKPTIIAGIMSSKLKLESNKKFDPKTLTKPKKTKTKKLFNLRKFVADKLLKLGVKVDHVDKDTFAEKRNFFSYRRSSKLKHKDYGRCISTVRLL